MTTSKNKKTNKQKFKVLMAEDDKYVSRAFEAGLTQAGFAVTAVNDGREAIKKIKECEPDILLLDLLMPHKSGFEVVKEIKKDDKLKEIPILVMSNLDEDKDIKKARKLGVNEYLLKANFTMSSIIDKIKKYQK